jgi:hypothetical protein
LSGWIKDHPENINRDTPVIIHSGSEHGAAKIKEHVPDAHIIPCAWKKEVFDRVVEVINLKNRRSDFS